MLGPPGDMPPITGRIPEQRLSINPGYIPQYFDSAIIPSDQRHIPIDKTPANMPMNQGIYISRHMTPPPMNARDSGHFQRVENTIFM